MKVSVGSIDVREQVDSPQADQKWSYEQDERRYPLDQPAQVRDP